MLIGGKRYDSELQMYVVEPREPDLTRLRFLRWLGERGQLEHRPLGKPIGLFAVETPPEPPTAA